MAKEINIESIISDRQLDKVLDFLKEVSNNNYKDDEKRREMDNVREERVEQLMKEPKQNILNEMNRVFEEMQKTDPRMKEYYQLAENYKKLMGILDKSIW